MPKLNFFLSKYFKTSFLMFFTIFLICIFSLLFAFTLKTNDTFYKREVSVLKEKINLIYPHTAAFLDKQQQTVTDFFEYSKDSLETYVLVDQDGRVLKQSKNEIFDISIESIRQKKVDSSGFGVRKIYNLEEELTYIILYKKVLVDGRLAGSILVGAPVKGLESGMGIYSGVGMPLLLAAFLLSLMFAFFMAKNDFEPISELLDVCKSISQGDLNRRVSLLPDNEIGDVGLAINHLSADVLKKITKLSLEKTELKSILSVMREGIVSVDHNGDINFCNRNAYKLVDSATADVRGMNISVASGFKALSGITDKVLLSRLLSKETMKLSVVDEKGNSSERIIEVQAAYYNTRDYKDSDFPKLHLRTRRGAILILNDVTDIRRLESIRRDFFANVSHELKTPLTSIKGYVETLLDGALEDPKFASRFVSKIESNADRLSELVYELLNLAKIEGGEDNDEMSSVQWGPIVSQIISRHESLAAKKSIDVKIAKDFASDTVIGDEASMSTIFENLLTNAIRYSKDDGKIEISFVRRDNFLGVRIKDFGIGISAENLERIFERFYRTDVARTRDVGGTGLGLSIVKHLAGRMNGDVEVQSVEGEGSVFTVYLPRSF